MRDPGRIEPMMALLREVWEASPDMRLGQLIENAHSAAVLSQRGPSLFHTEDQLLELGLRSLLVRWKKLEGELASVKARVDGLLVESLKHEEDATKAKKERDAAQNLGGQWQASYGKVEGMYKDQFERNRKLENDLAKVKKFFGEKAFAEALAAE